MQPSLIVLYQRFQVDEWRLTPRGRGADSDSERSRRHGTAREAVKQPSRVKAD